MLFTKEDPLRLDRSFLFGQGRMSIRGVIQEEETSLDHHGSQINPDDQWDNRCPGLNSSIVEDFLFSLSQILV